ncbi:MAG: exosortase H-associated membrane protein [Arhodomonas sp.]|nr:exosortase H-associated membrane protein [Arhodomonas sp.]
MLWLVIAFSLWAWMSPLLLLPLGWFMDPLLTALQPAAVSGAETSRVGIDVVTRFDPSVLPGRGADTDGRAAEVVFSVNALKYGYGLPIIAALTLAAEGGAWPRRLACVLTGFLLVLAIQAWGVTFEALLTLGHRLGPEVAAAVELPRLGREGVALGYQLGSLILPPVIPVIWWAGWHMPEVLRLAGRETGPQ